ncbi:type I-E CRISPR-associated protein Cas5/CasD [Pseudoalteromonas sp. KG3]|uniref:type I-E CRISPR-associated protein Cas5/CasD n=1 Tax=Pseudoalteromonas TaxID=53246 RepID=UPI0024BBFE17|nr:MULTISPECIES: type I-E CRISPR-associated protein Cas5/CasD [Pseudoalteromonas]WKD25978.1 type I-E CRISPR-associated protein Cas5/CasD [Pseudoalteromonas sp. KG3]
MKEYLVFRLYGPLASWGQAAVGGDRLTGLQPTRSAILGLLGAALGIKREQAERLQALQTSVNIAVKQTVPTSLMRDYHTTQVPSYKNKVVHRTRKSELSEDKLNTILSSRDYRCDGVWIISIYLTSDAVHTLEQLKKALETPVYLLSLGRKSCPLAAPMMPKIVKTTRLKQALDTDFPSLLATEKEEFFNNEERIRLNANGWVSYFWEGEKSEFIEQGVITTQPWDEPISRDRWQFKQRVMHQITLKENHENKLEGGADVS